MLAGSNCRQPTAKRLAQLRRGATNVTTLLAIPILLTLVVGAVQMTRVLAETSSTFTEDDERPSIAFEVVGDDDDGDDDVPRIPHSSP